MVPCEIVVMTVVISIITLGLTIGVGVVPIVILWPVLEVTISVLIFSVVHCTDSVLLFRMGLPISGMWVCRGLGRVVVMTVVHTIVCFCAIGWNDYLVFLR